MAREPEELVEMRRVLGAQLAANRQAAELSQGQLAIATVVDRTTVAHIEKARARGDERFWTIADAKCRAEGALLAGFRAWEAAKQEHEVRAREARLAEARARAEELRAPLLARLYPDAKGLDGTEMRTGIAPGEGAALTEELIEDLAEQLTGSPSMGNLAGDPPAAAPDEIVGELARLLCRWMGAMNRRKLFQLMRWAASITAVPALTGVLNPDEQDRLAKAITSPGRVDEQVIDHIETIHRYCKQQDDKLGARAVLPTALGQRDLVRDLLAECPTSLRPRLLGVYSNMSSSIGFYFFDLNKLDNAMHYGEQARAAAEDAGNATLGIHALGHMSYFASWQGKTDVGMNLVAAATNLLSKVEEPLMRACVAQRAATVFALDGQHGACIAEFDQAQNCMASTGPVSIESPAYFYSEGFLASKKSECLLRLARPDEAATNARVGLATYDNSFVGSRAFCTLRLGQALLQSGEVNEAALVVGDAVSLAAQTRQTRLVKELCDTRIRMRPYQNTQAVKVLDEKLTSFGLTTNSAT